MPVMGDPTDQLEDMILAYIDSPHKNPIRKQTLIWRIDAVNDGFKVGELVRKTALKSGNILHVAARNGDVHIIIIIIKAMRGESRVSCVSQKRHQSVWDTLIVLFGAKAKCNTVLHEAVRHWRTHGMDTVNAILFGCDLSDAEILLLLSATDERGRTPAEVAKTSKKVLPDKKSLLEKAFDDRAQTAHKNITKQGNETDGRTGVDNELQKEIDRLKRQNGQLQNDKDDLQRDVGNLITERDNLKARVDKMRQDFEVEITSLQSRMNQDIIHLRSANQARDDKINSMSTELEKIKSMLSTREKNMIGTDQLPSTVNNYPSHSSNNISMSYHSSDTAHRSYITHQVIAKPVQEDIID